MTDMVTKGIGNITGNGALGAVGSAYLKSQGVDPSILSNPNPKNLATTALTAYLVSMGVPPFIAGPLAGKAVDTILSGEFPDISVKDLLSDKALKDGISGALKGLLAENGIDLDAAKAVADNIVNNLSNAKAAIDALKNKVTEASNIALNGLLQAQKALEDKLKSTLNDKIKVIKTKIIPTDVLVSPPTGLKDAAKLVNVADSTVHYQQGNEAVDIDRFPSSNELVGHAPGLAGHIIHRHHHGPDPGGQEEDPGGHSIPG